MTEFILRRDLQSDTWRIEGLINPIYLGGSVYYPFICFVEEGSVQGWTSPDTFYILIEPVTFFSLHYNFQS